MEGLFKKVSPHASKLLVEPKQIPGPISKFGYLKGVPSDLQIVQSVSGNLIFFAKMFLQSVGSCCVKSKLIIRFYDAILHAET